MVALSLVAILLLSGCVGDPLDELCVADITYDEGYWEELVVPAHAVGEGWPAPGSGNCQSGYVYNFADEPLAVDETYIHFTFQMPHSWKEGTDVTFSVRFVFNADEVGTKVRWKIAYSWADVGDDFLVPLHMWALSDPANNDSLKHQITKFAPVSGAGHNTGSILLCYLSRNSSDALDTYTDTAHFVSVSLLYQSDSPGSLEQWNK